MLFLLFNVISAVYIPLPEIGSHIKKIFLIDNQKSHYLLQILFPQTLHLKYQILRAENIIDLCFTFISNGSIT